MRSPPNELEKVFIISLICGQREERGISP